MYPENVTVINHPLVQHKISMLRDIHTGTNEFRRLTEEIAMLMGYEALRDLPLEDVEITTPLETCMTPMIAGKKLAVVPILRAGLGMVSGILALTPSAKVGHIGPVSYTHLDVYKRQASGAAGRYGMSGTPGRTGTSGT